MRIRTIPYLPSFTITLVSILTLLIPGYPFKNCCGGMEKSKEGSEEQVRYELAKSLDTLEILLFLVAFLFGFGGTLLSAPYLVVQ